MMASTSFDRMVVETSQQRLIYLWYFLDNFSTSSNESNIKLKPCFVNLYEFHYFCRACIFFLCWFVGSRSSSFQAAAKNWNMSCLRNCSFEWTCYTYLHNNGVLNKIYDLDSRIIFFFLPLTSKHSSPRMKKTHRVFAHVRFSAFSHLFHLLTFLLRCVQLDDFHLKWMNEIEMYIQGNLP